jgi:NAD(P)-dependent dehydrogenase (short-subunit alcohol dehydrogenase family)
VAGQLASPEGSQFAPAYAASKAAVDQLTRHLAAQFVNEGITVNCLAPAAFPSKMMAFALASEQGREVVANSHPVGRYGSEDDMAGAALFLASRASAFITGSTIYLDGGSVNIRTRASM